MELTIEYQKNTVTLQKPPKNFKELTEEINKQFDIKFNKSEHILQYQDEDDDAIFISNNQDYSSFVNEHKTNQIPMYLELKSITTSGESEDTSEMKRAQIMKKNKQEDYKKGKKPHHVKHRINHKKNYKLSGHEEEGNHSDGSFDGESSQMSHRSKDEKKDFRDFKKEQRKYKKLDQLKNIVTDAIFDNLPLVATLLRDYLNEPTQNFVDKVNQVRPKTEYVDVFKPNKGEMKFLSQKLQKESSLATILENDSAQNPTPQQSSTENNTIANASTKSSENSGIESELMSSISQLCNTYQNCNEESKAQMDNILGGKLERIVLLNQKFGSAKSKSGTVPKANETIMKGTNLAKNAQPTGSLSKSENFSTFNSNNNHNTNTQKNQNLAQSQNINPKKKDQPKPEQGISSNNKEQTVKENPFYKVKQQSKQQGIDVPVMGQKSKPEEVKNNSKDAGRKLEKASNEYSYQIVKEVSQIPNPLTEKDKVIYKTIIIKNSASKGWPNSAFLENIKGVSGGIVQIKDMKAGEEKSVVFQLKSPMKAGQYQSTWRVVFKTKEGVEMVVGEPFTFGINIHSSKDDEEKKVLEMTKKEAEEQKKSLFDQLKNVFPDADPKALETLIEKNPGKDLEFLANKFIS